MSLGPGAEVVEDVHEIDVAVVGGVVGVEVLVDVAVGEILCTHVVEVVAALEATPVAEEVGVRMAIHPDDPPRPLMGLPRIVSNAEDLAYIVGTIDSPSNGITLCTGSLGAGPTNDVPAIAKRFAGKVHFAHLRNVAKEPDGSFMEADHLGGDTDQWSVLDRDDSSARVVASYNAGRGLRSQGPQHGPRGRKTDHTRSA